MKRGFSSVASLAQRVPAAKRLRAKIAISIDGELAREADALAREMGVTRSGLYAMALREFIRRRESAVLLEKQRRNRRLLGEEER